VRLVARLVLIPLSLMLAIAAGTAFLTGAIVLDPAARRLAGELWEQGIPVLAEALVFGDSTLVFEGGPLSAAATTLLVLPPLFTALLAEVAGLRSLAWHAGATGAVTAMLPWLLRESQRDASATELHLSLLLLATGAASGLVYWLLAGRSAGGPRALSAPVSSKS
jgi:hypothetical protein